MAQMRACALSGRGQVGPRHPGCGSELGCSDVLLLNVLVLVVLGDLFRLAGPDLDPARLHGLRDLTHQLNREQAIVEPGATHLYVVSDVEGLLERASRDPTMQILPALVGAALLACHKE